MRTTSETCQRFLLALAAVCLFPWPAVAHPGSGIVVDRQGQIYFLDTGAGVWKIDAHGKLTQIPGPRFHWMTLDTDDAIRRVSPQGQISAVERR